MPVATARPLSEKRRRKLAARSPALDALAYFGLRVFEMIVRMSGIAANYAAGRVLAELAWRFDRRHREIALDHLRRSFPEWSERRRVEVGRASFRSMVYMFLEVLLAPRLIRPTTWDRYVRLRATAEGIRTVIEHDGMILLTGHFGNFEIVGYTMATLGLRTYSVARRLDNPRVDAHVLGVRERTGQTILDKSGATAVVPDLLERGEAVCFVADQDAGRKGLFVDFFGRPASTFKSFGLLAMQHRVPLAIGVGRRLGETFRFEISVERLIRPEEWDGRDDPLRWITQEYTRALEAVARRHPEQYWWFHRRWKHRPRTR